MCRTLSLLLLIATFAVAGCAHSLPASVGSETSKVQASPEARAEFEKKVRRENEGGREDLRRRSPVRWTSTRICWRPATAISPAPEDSEIKASCTLRLEAMRKELSDLSDLLRDGR